MFTLKKHVVLFSKYYEKVGGTMPNIRFNGHDNPSYVLIHDITDNFLPAVNINTMKINGRNGEHRFSKQIGKREISVTISIDARRFLNTLPTDNRDYVGLSNEAIVKIVARRLANTWLYSETPVSFINYDEPNVHYLAEVVNAGNLAQALSLGRATITFLCADPHAYNNVKSVVTHINLPANGSIEFENSGKDVFPHFRMTFTGNISHFRMVTKNRQLTFGTVGGPIIFRNNDVLEIDGERGLILLTRAGAQSPVRFYDALNPNSEFLKFTNGFNAVTFEARTAVRNVEMSLRKRWF